MVSWAVNIIFDIFKNKSIKIIGCQEDKYVLYFVEVVVSFTIIGTSKMMWLTTAYEMSRFAVKYKISKSVEI